MSANTFDLSSNYIAGIRVTTKNSGLGAVKPTGNSALASQLHGIQDIDDLETALKTVNATYYTNERLRRMNKNDMVYALRVAHDAASMR